MTRRPRSPLTLRARSGRIADRLLVVDIDDTLLGDSAALGELASVLEARGGTCLLAVASGRGLAKCLEPFTALPPALVPSVIACDVGTRLYLRDLNSVVPFPGWAERVAAGWDRAAAVEALSALPGLCPQEEDRQGPFKASWYVDGGRFPGREAVCEALRARGVEANVVRAFGIYLDVLPARAGKGGAARFIAESMGLEDGRVMVAGDSGNDLSMLEEGFPAVVVANHEDCLEELRGKPGVHFAAGRCAGGILEGLEVHGFLD